MKEINSIDKNKNCFNFIRLLVAIVILFCHYVMNMKLELSNQIFHAVKFINAIPIFFALSGLLIWFSLDHCNSTKEYFKKRFLRIYPELWLVVILEIISIMIFYDKWDIKSLFLFTLTQGTFLQFWTPNSLRGYGCGTPNGSLWFICVLIQFYIVIVILYKLLKNKKTYVWVITFISSVLISIFGYEIVKLFNNEILLKLFDQTIFRHLWIFLIGCFVADKKETIIPFLKKFWFVFLIIAGIIYFFLKDIYLNYALLHTIFLVLGVFGFAYAFPNIKIKYDISYELIIYHMIFVNIFIESGYSNWVSTIYITLITIFVSILTRKIMQLISIKK